MKRQKDEKTEKFERLNCTSANPSDRSTGRQERKKDRKTERQKGKKDRKTVCLPVLENSSNYNYFSE